jgi:hypothetical protein
MKNMIMANKCMAVEQLLLFLDIGEASVCRILEQFGFADVCVRWFLQKLTGTHRFTKPLCRQTFRHGFLSHIVMGDETCLHHFEHKMKRQSIEWHHVNFLRKKKKFKPGTIMATVF